jgi:HSP20 family molecular chaperone IbpA
MAKKRVISPEVCTHHHPGKNYCIHIRLPGVRKENIDLKLSKKEFCVKGSRADVDFAGCYSLAHSVNVNKAKAKFYDKDGLLEIIVPLTEPLRRKKITVK